MDDFNKLTTQQQNHDGINMSDRSNTDNLVKKSVLLGIMDKLSQIRSCYVSGDNVHGEWMISNLIEDLNEYEKEIGKENSTF